ncbi:VWA domain-containing protein [Mediterraneibacter glycyrrhizinilyticus]|uniref:VWA domain-containing protein n=1 Tax=Mediterraneibacter glycyrrhizinilyticus TaxID=342942 RepID=UPI002659A7F6|nr:VWA domain-containing protein [Mediterraneibacter glycyrrhizinilyticus]MCF2567766.1 VWA domain-containing protein [Mediterraneibacter glycyrrhizinilyticus]
MKTRGWFSKLLTASLAVLMLTGMSSADASAATREAEETEPGSNLFMGKTATLQDDGTYTIQLEAFSTGESTTVMTQTPTDIVLVLDVSGSMEENFTYVSGQEWTSVTDTVASTPDDAYHHCPDGSYSPITWTETGSILGFGRYRYVCDNCRASRKWDSPTLVNRIPGEGDDDSWNLWRYTDIERTEEKMVALKEAVNSFLSGVADRNENIGETDQQHRVSIVKFASETTRNTIGNDRDWNGYNYTQTIAGMTTVTDDSLSSLTGAVDALTPGGATAADKGLDMAQSILNNNSTDSSRNKVVVLFTDGEPTYGSSFSSAVANDAVATAKELKDSGATIYTIGLFSGADPSDTSERSNAYMNGVSSNYPAATSYTNLGSGSNNGYYKTVSATGSLVDIFEEIEDSISTTTVTLTDEAELRDILNTGFVLTDASEVTVQTDNYSGRDRAGNRVFAGNPQNYNAAAINRENNTIKVSGFDFSKEYLIDGDTPDDSDFTAAKQGRKLIITITNVEATDDAVTNDLISTNNAASGIYENSDASTPFAVFEQPQTQLSSKAYVVDYAKEISTADIPNSVTNLSVDGMKKFTSSVTSLNKGENGLSYGTATADSYTPATTNWNGYDTYYAFGQWETVPEGVTTGNNTWTKISVIPANNVYYEDDFITNESTGTVGIEYSGTWEVDGTSSGNTETPNTEVHGGWQNGSLADDDKYSDESAHYADLEEGVATATFTFTGTGVDVYSRTNMTTGYVAAQLYKGEDTSAAALSQYLVVDNQAESGDYYQIPTVSFTGLDHGTYTVKLTVAATSDGRSTYYLDGIRVYNPLSYEQEADSTVSGAYGDEVGAVFMEVRDILIDTANVDEDGTASLSGAVFLDKHGDNTEGTYSVGEYEAYGPKNEVYLAKGQAVAIATGSLDKISIGLKAPEGETEATVTNSVDISPIPISSASDLYYQVTANEQGFVVVQNTGDNLLAITKVKTSGTGELVSFSLADMLSYANEFDSLNVVDYTQEPSDEDQTVTEPSDPSDTEEGDVVIENPSETPDQDDAAQPENPITAWFNNLINGIKNLFGRW